MKAIKYPIKQIIEYFRDFKSEIIDEMLLKIEKKREGWNALFVRSLLLKIYPVLVSIMITVLNQIQ